LNVEGKMLIHFLSKFINDYTQKSLICCKITSKTLSLYVFLIFLFMYLNKILKGISLCDGCYYQINEYYFVAVQGQWFLKSICDKELAYEIDA